MTGWTKRMFIDEALSELGLAGYAYDAEPEELQTALRRLDSMMAEWNEKGIRISWPLTNDPRNADLDTDTEAPDRAYEAIYTNLAVKIAPSYGKTPSPDTKASARNSYQTVLNHYVKPRSRKLPQRVAGAGNTNRFGTDSAYLPPECDNQIGPPTESIGFTND